MCKCTPNLRTLFCGRPGCEWPKVLNLKERNKMDEKMISIPSKLFDTVTDFLFEVSDDPAKLSVKIAASFIRNQLREIEQDNLKMDPDDEKQHTPTIESNPSGIVDDLPDPPNPDPDIPI